MGGGGGGATGATLTVALALLVGSARLVAVIVTVCGEVIPLGAVYRPDVVRIPLNGDNDHCTPVFVVFNTVALNCCDAPAFSCTLAGLIATLTGGAGDGGGCGDGGWLDVPACRNNAVLVDTLGFTTAVAVTVTTENAATLLGAV